MPFMPRKAIPIQAGVQSAIDQISAYCAGKNVSVLALAKASKTSQSALFRFLRGDRKTITPCARATLEYINSIDNRHNQHSGDTIPKGVEEALRETWDGNPQSINLLVALIRALKPALDAAALSQRARTVGRAE